MTEIMDEENIYDDLDDFLLDQRVEKVQENNKELQETFEKLEETTKKFNEDISNLKKINQTLERNISALFKTAKNELERKDNKIAELRHELENLKFRRAAKPKPEDTGGLVKEIEQKNRIIQSLTKQLECLEKSKNPLKRNSIEDDDLRNRLGCKKRKLDDDDDRSRSRSNSHFDNNKKRTIRRHRSGSLEPRKSHHPHPHHHLKKNRYSPPPSHSSNRKHSQARHPAEHHPKNNKNNKDNKDINIKSRSRSSSMDRKKIHNNHKNSETKIQNNHLIKEDSCNNLIPKTEVNINPIKNITESETKIKSDLELDLEEGEIDCTLEDIISDDDISKTKLQPPKNNPSKECAPIKDDVLELMVQSNYLDDLDIDAEISKMRVFEDEKRKKQRKEDKHRISKLKNAISECKQNIQLLEHNIYNEDETEETEDEFNKTTSTFNVEQNNLVLKISKKKSSDDEPKTEDKPSEKINDATEPIIKVSEKLVETNTVLETTNIVDDITKFANNNLTNGSIEHQTIENKLQELFNVDNENKEVDLVVKEPININKNTEKEIERKVPLKAKRRRAFICIT